MARPVAPDEQAAEVVACAIELERIAARLVAYDGTENRAHLALAHNGKNAAEVIAALVRGDEQERKMLADLRRDAALALSEARRLAGRLSNSENQLELVPTWSSH